MGWRGTIRSVVAISRRIERENERQQRAAVREQLYRARQYERDLKQWNKERALQAAQQEVADSEALFERLLSIHKDCGEACDWKGIQDSPPPAAPERSVTRETTAQEALTGFKPSLIDKAFGRTDTKISSLQEQVLHARKQDDEEYQKLYAAYVSEYEQWTEQVKLATLILSGDLHSYEEAVAELKPFADLIELGSSVTLEFKHPLLVHVEMKVNGEDVVPKETKKLLQSGKVSCKALGNRQFYEIYQDYVCGSVLRIVREIFAILPVEHIVVNAVADIVSSQTGQLEQPTILSVYAPRATIDRLNWQHVDPSDALKNFRHVTGFQRGEGFHSVTPLDVSIS